MARKTKIFDTTQPIVRTQCKNPYTYIAIKSAQYGVFFNKAPILGIDITETVDYNISKFLSGNFGLVTFQDMPVIIKLSGITQLVSTKDCDKGEEDKNTIFQLFKAHKASNPACKPLQFTIGKASYKGFMVSLKSSSSERFPGIAQYSITLVATRNK